MISIQTNEVDYIIELELDEEITEKDIEEFKTYFSRKKKDHDKLNVLIKIKNLDYNIDSFIEGVRFDIKHLDDFGKIAVLSDNKRVEIGSKVIKYMPKVEIEHFNLDERDKAVSWLK